MTYIKKPRIWSMPDDDLRFRPTTKHDLTAEWTNYFDSLKLDHKLFTITVVFKPNDGNNSKDRWESEYRTAVLNKFRRALVKNKKYQSKALLHDDFFYFERHEASIHKISGSRNPFHIHALLPIPSHQIERVWDEVNQEPKPRLLKDVLSIATVQDLEMKPVIESLTIAWVRYITKCKEV
jgi:hypothetical protein